MSLFDSIILGIVEGITEFLPVSSTGHLILASNILKIDQSDFLKSFEIAIQLGAILSVVVLYFKKFFNLELLKRIIVAFLPTAVVGFVFYGFIKKYLLSNTDIVLWALGLGGAVLIFFEFWYKDKEKTQEKSITDMSYWHCLLVGLFQSLAIIPGVSRSGATILGGLWLGMPRKTIVEFSFLLALPTMVGATGLDLIQNASSFSSDQFEIIISGLILSFVTAILAIKFLLSFIQRHTFLSFGFYRIAVAVAFLWFIF